MICLNNDQLVIAGICGMYIFYCVHVHIARVLIAYTWHLSRRTEKEHPDKKDYWQNELRSLGIEPRRQNEFNDEEELRVLAERIKAVYYQHYKTVNNNNC